MLAQIRMCLVTAVFSSFVNDTPVYCIMLPIVLTWAARARYPLKQLLIPLSYCALLGGINTSIGTSTNLVVTGQFEERVLDPASEYYQPGLSPIQLFGLTPYGLPNTIWGIIYIMLAAPFLLPEGAGKRLYRRYQPKSFRKTKNRGDAIDLGAEFLVGLQAADDSPVVGRSIEDAGLRHLDGQFLVSVRRGEKVYHAVGPEFVIQAGDILFFAGVPDGLDDLALQYGLLPFSDALEQIGEEDVPGLKTGFGVEHIGVPKAPTRRLSSSALPGNPQLELVEAHIKKSAPIVGQSIKEVGFRSRFHAAVISIKRKGVPIVYSAPIGEEILEAGDELLLDVAPQFWTAPEVNENFANIGPSGQVRTNNELMLAMRVVGAPTSGKTVNQAGLRQLPAAFLVSITRKGEIIHAVSPDEVLQKGDILWFAGSVGSVRFIRNTPGLVPLANKHASSLKNTSIVERRLVQAIVDPASPLIGKTPKEVLFREQFNAAIIAIGRKGERLHAKPGDVVLTSGDILLLDTGAAFAQLHADSRFFSIVIEMENSNPPRFLHTFIAIGAVAAAFILYALEIFDILLGAAVVVAIMLLTGCMSPNQARKAIKWDVYLMIAGSFGVSAAMEQSGAAAAIANGVVSIGQNAGGDTFVIAAIYIATTLMSQVISNNSAAALVFPIAATISKNYGIDIYILSYAVMLGASSVFMSSFGYQTNLMALAQGGYSSMDFLKMGSPMQIVLAVVSIVTLALGTGQWHIMWIITGVSGGVILGAPQVMDFVASAKNKKKLKHVS